MNNPEFLAPCITAFDERGRLDLDGHAAACDYVIDGGVDGLLLLGSTGEFFALDGAEKRTLIQATVRQVAGRRTLLAGTGCNSTQETIALSNDALEAGVDAVAVITPYYFPLAEADLYRHFAAVATAVPGPIFLYNIPATTGTDVTPQLFRRLTDEFENIVGIKDTVANMAHTRGLIQALGRDDVKVYSGLDENFVHNFVSGGSGCIAGLANIYPEVCAAWVRAAKSRDLTALQRIQAIIDRLSELYALEPVFIPVVKRAMQLRGADIPGACRAPITQLSTESIKSISKLLARTDEELAAGALP